MTTDNVSDEKLESVSEKMKEQAKYYRQNVFVFLLYTSDILNKYLEIHMKKSGFNQIRYNILGNLITHGGRMKPTDISKRVFRSKTTLTRVIDGMEKDGLVKREPIGEDRRTREVTITSEGVRLIEDTMPVRRKVTDMAMSCLNKEQTGQLDTILTQFRRHLRSLITGSSGKS